MDEFSKFPLIAADVGLSRIGNRKELYARLLNSFVNNPGDGNLQAAFDNRDIDGVIMAVHASNGLAANLSLVRMQKCAQWVEAEFKKARDEGDETVFEAIPAALFIDVVRETVDEIKTVIETLK